MKKHQVLLFTCIGFVLFACNDKVNKREILQGKWNVDKAELVSSDFSDSIIHLNTHYYVFNADGTGEAVFPSGTVPLSWDLSADENEFLMTFPQPAPKTDVFDIMLLSGNTLIMHTGWYNGNNGMQYHQRMSLSKME